MESPATGIPSRPQPESMTILLAASQRHAGPAIRDSMIPREYLRFDIRDFDKDGCNLARDFLLGSETILLLYGGTGSRKSTLAAAILRIWREAGFGFTTDPDCRDDHGMFLPGYEAAKMFRTFDDPNVTEKVLRVERTKFLVLDDFGAGRQTPHVTEQLVFLIQERYDWQRKTIVTSNLGPDEIASIDDRVMSRMAQGLVKDCGSWDWRVKSK